MRIKDYNPEIASEFGNLAHQITRMPLQILERVTKANDKVDFSSGRFQEIAIDVESISSEISEKNYLLCEEIENIILGLLIELNRCQSFEADLTAEVNWRNSLQMEVDQLKKQIENLTTPDESVKPETL